MPNLYQKLPAILVPTATPCLSAAPHSWSILQFLAFVRLFDGDTNDTHFACEKTSQIRLYLFYKIIGNEFCRKENMSLFL
jgi:hypothetical protein